MNPPSPFPGGGFIPGTPIWYPPVATKWLFTALIVFVGAMANRFKPNVRNIFASPAGFFVTALVAMYVFQEGHAPLAFAIFFMLLMMWSVQLAENKEGFLCASNAYDWVTTSKRWLVERVLKERPVAIQERDVATYPVSGSS